MSGFGQQKRLLSNVIIIIIFFFTFCFNSYVISSQGLICRQKHPNAFSILSTCQNNPQNKQLKVITGNQMVYFQTVQASNLCLLHLSQTTHCTSHCDSSCRAKRKEIDQLKIDNKTKCQLHLQQHIFSRYNMYIFASHHNCHHMVHENANLTSSFHVN